MKFTDEKGEKFEELVKMCSCGGCVLSDVNIKVIRKVEPKPMPDVFAGYKIKSTTGTLYPVRRTCAMPCDRIIIWSSMMLPDTISREFVTAIYDCADDLIWEREK